MTTAQIQARRLAGESLVQIAASKDPVVSEDTLISTIIKAYLLNNPGRLNYARCQGR
jgi:hypothetical protein